MNKVFVVYELTLDDPYEYTYYKDMDKIFATKESAEEYIKKAEKLNPSNKYYWLEWDIIQ